MALGNDNGRHVIRAVLQCCAIAEPIAERESVTSPWIQKRISARRLMAAKQWLPTQS